MRRTRDGEVREVGGAGNYETLHETLYLKPIARYNGPIMFVAFI